jgi:hypothetical protein
MEPLNEDELSDRELDAILREWTAPPAPASLRASIFPVASRPWWRNLWTASIRIPLPAAIAMAMVLAVVAWPWIGPAAPQANVHELQPVAVLRPVIIRSGE